MVFLLWILISVIAFSAVDDPNSRNSSGTHRRVYGIWNSRKIQTIVLDYIFNELLNPDARQREIVEACHQLYHVPKSTIYKWLKHFRTHHELPVDTIAFYNN